MDNSVLKFVATIADCNRRFAELTEKLRSHQGVIGVTHGVDCRNFEKETRLELFADAELADDTSVCWWLEVCWTNKECRIECSVLESNVRGQDRVREFPDKFPESLDDLIAELERSTDELIESFGEDLPGSDRTV